MIATRIICKMINPPAKVQTGIFNRFIDPPPPKIYDCNEGADENAMRNYSRRHYREFQEGPCSGRFLRTCAGTKSAAKQSGVCAIRAMLAEATQATKIKTLIQVLRLQRAACGESAGQPGGVPAFPLCGLNVKSLKFRRIQI